MRSVGRRSKGPQRRLGRGRRGLANCRGHGCRACKVACFVEYNAIFSLDPATLLNTAKYYKR